MKARACPKTAKIRPRPLLGTSFGLTWMRLLSSLLIRPFSERKKSSTCVPASKSCSRGFRSTAASSEVSCAELRGGTNDPGSVGPWDAPLEAGTPDSGFFGPSDDPLDDAVRSSDAPLEAGTPDSGFFGSCDDPLEAGTPDSGFFGPSDDPLDDVVRPWDDPLEAGTDSGLFGPSGNPLEASHVPDPRLVWPCADPFPEPDPSKTKLSLFNCII
jgi:hypothetical protein